METLIALNRCYPKMSKQEITRIARFAIVGISVAVVYAGGFTVLHQLGLHPGISSVLAFSVAVSWQYFAQTLWTFRSSARDARQASRFATTIAMGFFVSTAITGLFGPLLGFSEWLSLGIVMVWLPVQNYLVFRLWVYRRSMKLRHG